MALERQNAVATAGAPQSGRPVARGRGDLGAVWGEDPGHDPIGVAPESVDAIARRGIQHLGGP
eukprot:3669314-Alexandrium_andersonii.AAC.1